MFSQKASTASTSPAATRAEPRTADLLDEPLAVRGDIRGQRVQPEEGFRTVTGRRAPSSRATSSMRRSTREVQPIAGFDLDGGDALGHQPLRAHRGGLAQAPRTRGARGTHGGLDAAAGARDLLVRDTAEPLLELGDAVAAVHQMRVAIDEARRDPQAVCLQRRQAAVRRARCGPRSAAPIQAMRSPLTAMAASCDGP